MDAIQLLVEHGHTWRDVQRYTLTEFRMFCAAADRSQRRRLVDQLAVVRTATNGDQAAVKGFLRSLG